MRGSTLAVTIEISYVGVRAALDWSLDEVSLPEDIIKLDQYEGEAERWVLSKLNSGVDIDLPAVVNAKLHYTAALLCETMPNITSERLFTSRGEGWTREKINIPALEASLRRKAGAFINVANEVPVDKLPKISTIFTLAQGYRGRL